MEIELAYFKPAHEHFSYYASKNPKEKYKKG